MLLHQVHSVPQATALQPELGGVERGMGRVRPGCPYAGPSIMSHIVMGPGSHQFTSLPSLASTSEWPPHLCSCCYSCMKSPFSIFE